MTKNNAIIEQLEAARTELNLYNSQIHELERLRDVAAGKVEAFELSVQYIADIQATPDNSKSGTSRKRMPSSDWQIIFGELLNRYNAGFGYEEIMAIAASLNSSLKKPSLRTKMANLADKGYVNKLGDGRFQINVKGVEYFGLTTSNSSPQNTEPNLNTGKLPAMPMPMPMPGMRQDTMPPVTNKAPRTQVQEAPKVTEDVSASSNENSLPENYGNW